MALLWPLTIKARCRSGDERSLCGGAPEQKRKKRANNPMHPGFWSKATLLNHPFGPCCPKARKRGAIERALLIVLGMAARLRSQ